MSGRAWAFAIGVLLLGSGFALRAGQGGSLIADLRDWFRTQVTRSDLRRLGRALESEYAASGHFPEDFGEFIQESLSKRDGDARLDPWGTELMLRTRRDEYELVSAGPDTTFETTDDIVVGGRGEYVK